MSSRSVFAKWAVACSVAPFLLLAGINACSANDTAKSNKLDACRGATDDTPVDASPDAAAGAQVPSQEQQAHEDCVAAGLSSDACDAAHFISRAEAICVARALDAPNGVEPWRVTLVFAAVTKRVVWDVRVTTAPRTAEHYAIDAITGDLVRRSTSTAVD